VAKRQFHRVIIDDQNVATATLVIELVVRRLPDTRFVTISPEDLTREKPTYKLPNTGGGDPKQLDLPF